MPQSEAARQRSSARRPECDFTKKPTLGIPCLQCGEGELAEKRSRRGKVFYGCSRYPKCDFTTSREPLGPVHDADQGPVARRDDESGICLACGARVPLPGGVVPELGTSLPGGPADPAALARPVSAG